MKKALLVMSNNIRRGKMMLFLAAGASILLCGMLVLFYSLEDSQWSVISVGLIDRDESLVSRDFSRYLDEDLSMDVKSGTSMREMEGELIEKHISVAIIIPEGFEASVLNAEPKPIATIFTDDYANITFTRSYLESYTSALSALSVSAGGDARVLGQLLEETSERGIAASRSDADHDFFDGIRHGEVQRTVMGFYLFLVFLISIFVANALQEERTKGLYDRMRITGMNPVSYILGICVYAFLGVVIIIIPMSAYFSFAIDSSVPIPEMIGTALAYGIFAIAFALFSGLYMKSRSAIMTCLTGITTIMCTLGGTWFHINLSPPFMQAIARATPQFWFMDAFDTASGSESGFGTSWGLAALVIALFALFFFLLAGLHFVYGRKRAS